MPKKRTSPEQFVKDRDHALKGLTDTRALCTEGLKQILDSKDIDYHNRCLYCGKDLPNKQRKVYCSDECASGYYTHFDQPGIRSRLARERGYKCEDCKADMAEHIRHGNETWIIPKQDLQLHHIRPLWDGGHPFNDDNLILLCTTCHGKAHQAYNEMKRQQEREEREKLFQKQVKKMDKYWNDIEG